MFSGGQGEGEVKLHEITGMVNSIKCARCGRPLTGASPAICVCGAVEKRFNFSYKVKRRLSWYNSANGWTAVPDGLLIIDDSLELE
jgi:RecJ-like exonuclease